MKANEPTSFTSHFRWLLVVAILIIPQAVQAQWRATVGAQSNDRVRQALAFRPNEIWIHAGDNITWTFPTDEIHTVSFLKSGQTRLSRRVGCPGFSPDGSATFDGSTCVTTDVLLKGQTFTVTFPAAGNFKLVCLVHANMTAVVHVLDLSQPLPHDQHFYDDEAADERRGLLSDRDPAAHHPESAHSSGNDTTAGVGEIVATGGGWRNLLVVRLAET